MLLDQLLVERGEDGLFSKIEFEGGGWISVQANDSTACKPKINSEYSDVYYEFEVMVSGLQVPEWEPFWKETGLFGNVPRAMIEKLIARTPMYYYHDQEIVNMYSETPYQVYCYICEFTIKETKPFEEMRAVIVSLEGAIVHDGEGGNITICPSCKKDGLVIHRV